MLCTTCGSFVDASEWHPVTSTSDGGEFEIHHFCDRECRDAWMDDA